MSGWTDLAREISTEVHWTVTEPVIGDPEAYRNGATSYTELAEQIEGVGTLFDDYTGGDNPQFKGEAARAFNGLAETIREQLNLIPGIATDAAGILDNHGARLTELHEAADVALATARARWRTYESTKAELRSARDAAIDEAFADQIGDLAASPAEDRVQQLEDDLHSARTRLLESHDEAVELMNSEDTLEQSTNDGLKGIDLGAMADPGFWDKLGGALWDGILAIPIYGELFGMAAAALRGDWDAVLWRFRDLLDDILFIAGVVGTVLFVVGLVVGSAFAFPFVIAALLLGAAVTKLLIDIHLNKTQMEDPDNPGRTISKTDVALSGVAVVGAWFGLASGTGTIGAVTGRGQYADDAAGLVSTYEGSFTAGYGGAATVDEHLDVTSDPTTETEQRTDILDAAVDDQIDQLEEGTSPNDVFAVSPPAPRTPATVGGSSESDDDD